MKLFSTFILLVSFQAISFAQQAETINCTAQGDGGASYRITLTQVSPSLYDAKVIKKYSDAEFEVYSGNVSESIENKLQPPAKIFFGIDSKNRKLGLSGPVEPKSNRVFAMDIPEDIPSISCK